MLIRMRFILVLVLFQIFVHDALCSQPITNLNDNNYYNHNNNNNNNRHHDLRRLWNDKKLSVPRPIRSIFEELSKTDTHVSLLRECTPTLNDGIMKCTNISTRSIKPASTSLSDNNNIDNNNNNNNSINNAMNKIMKMRQSKIARRISKIEGFYYGLTSKTVQSAMQKSPKKLTVSETISETLEEIRILRKEMELMRQQMEILKSKMIADGDNQQDELDWDPVAKAAAKRKRQQEFEKIARDVEKWADRLVFQETEEDGWQAVPCNKMVKKSFKNAESTRAYLKWMKDSRGKHAKPNDDTEHPCIKIIATVDAPLEDVCLYLSKESSVNDYNEIIDSYGDLEEISPNSKICWGRTPQILIIKPREFVTFCHHRWRRDGSQIIINQACDHPDRPATNEEGDGNVPRAYALRGANYVYRNPEDPQKTNIVMLAHANPGDGIPAWACKTAINALVPIEPFRLFHNIDQGVRKKLPQLHKQSLEIKEVSTNTGNRSNKPAGIAQLGYACFWPNGGGEQEGFQEKIMIQGPTNDEAATSLSLQQENKNNDNSVAGATDNNNDDNNKDDLDETSSVSIESNNLTVNP